MPPIDNTAQSHPVRYKLRLHYARLYAGGIVDLQSKFACRSNLFVSILALRDLCGLALLRKNITLPHFKQLLACSWTSTASHSIFDGAGFIFKITLVRKNHRAGRPRPYILVNRISLIVKRLSLLVISNVFDNTRCSRPTRHDIGRADPAPTRNIFRVKG